MKIVAPGQVQFGQKLSSVGVGVGLPEINALQDEVLGMFHVLLGRADAPIDSPYLGLAEVATAYYARGLEIDAQIHEGEREGEILRGSDYYRFRTGALRSFIDAAKRMSELGSRRLTQEQLLQEQKGDAGA